MKCVDTSLWQCGIPFLVNGEENRRGERGALPDLDADQRLSESTENVVGSGRLVSRVIGRTDGGGLSGPEKRLPRRMRATMH